MVVKTSNLRMGFSNVTATMILSSVLLSIMLAAIYVSNDFLNTQMDLSEFKNSENLVLAIDSEINKLLFKPGSSSVIKTSFSKTAPGYTETGETMNITLESEGGGDPHNYSIEINFFNIDGSQAIPGNSNYTLRGDSSLLISPYDGVLGRIHVSRPQRMRVSLDYERVLCTFTGNQSLFDGNDYVSYNTIEVTCIVLTFGKFEVEDHSAIRIRNIPNGQKEHPTFILTGNCSITVSSGGVSEQIYLTDLKGNPAYDTQVNFHKIFITISVIGGS